MSKDDLEISISHCQGYINEYEMLIDSAKRQIEEHRQATGKKAKNAGESIHYLEHNFIPWQIEGIENARNVIERLREKLIELTFEEKEGQMQFLF